MTLLNRVRLLILTWRVRRGRPLPGWVSSSLRFLDQLAVGLQRAQGGCGARGDR